MNKLAILAFVSIAMVSGLANGAEWGQYGNARFGYWIDIPPRFSAITEADNGDGGISQSSDGSAELRVWGRHLFWLMIFRQKPQEGSIKT